MKPYLLKVPLVRKDSETRFDTCQVDHVVTLSEQEFRNFQHNPLSDYDFLREFNREYASAYTEGVRPGLMVLGEGSDDGIFVCTEGYDYARYSAGVPNARQIRLLKEYPSLETYGMKMAQLVDRNIQKAITVGLPERFYLPIADLKNNTSLSNFNEDLFLEMLENRPEVDFVDFEGGEIVLTISEAYLPKREHELRVLPDEEFKLPAPNICFGATGPAVSRRTSPTACSIV